jgi:hypothetical protein
MLRPAHRRSGRHVQVLIFLASGPGLAWPDVGLLIDLSPAFSSICHFPQQRVR